MQDRYTGDIGDFGKYALLRGLTADGLRLGVLWYLNDLQEHNRDGGFVEYAHLKDCDPDLYDKLDAIRKRTRGVAAVKASDILPAQTDYHSKPLDDGSSREKWFKDAKTEIAGSELVFVDPDTGIAPASLRPLSSKSVKYVLGA